MVLLEAMSCGVPVVSTRCGGPDDIVTDGEDGRLCALEDVREMAAAIADVLGSRARWQSMARRARLTVEERFSTEAAFVPFLDMYRRLH